MKRAPIFHWLIGIVIAAMAIAASFYFDDSVRHFILQHENRAMRHFMRYVSLFGDWPSHILVGLFLLGFAWRRGNKQWTRICLAMVIAMSLAGVLGTVIKRSFPLVRPSLHTDTLFPCPRFCS